MRVSDFVITKLILKLSRARGKGNKILRFRESYFSFHIFKAFGNLKIDLKINQYFCTDIKTL